ncbi:MAG TPA: ligase-associated DNA damage response endonuclease PdeM [Burkholderiaceae bacterium]|nr:ligase-associated DNA damage response endonuclease PdeM [Burkholderiaceae bacterium]
MQVQIGGATWMLSAERTAFWCERRWLVVADVHFGKAATFRALGVPVPHGTTSDTLTRLSRLIDRLQPSTIVFLGDLFHAREAHAALTLTALAEWRERHASLDLVLVEGNHDRRAGAPPAALRIHRELDPWGVDAFAFCHYPRFAQDAFAFAGHLHPAVRLHGRADNSIRLPCFWLRSSLDAGLMVLPAFGAFTGGAVIDREPGDRVIAVAEDRVVEVPAPRYDSCGQNI